MTDGARVDCGVLSLYAGSAVAGVVVDERGRPITDAEVRASASQAEVPSRLHAEPAAADAVEGAGPAAFARTTRALWSENPRSRGL